MSSIKIHQDIFNFERKRKGFTPRQLASIVAGASIAIGMTALLGYAIGIPYQLASVLATVFAFPAIVAGFLPIFGLPADKFATCYFDMEARGNAISWKGEEIDNMKGETNRAFKKRANHRGFECYGEWPEDEEDQAQ
jgi:hypothetical protein